MGIGILKKEPNTFKGVVFENSISNDDLNIYAGFRMEIDGLPEESVWAARVKFTEFWNYIEEQVKKEKE